MVEKDIIQPIIIQGKEIGKIGVYKLELVNSKKSYILLNGKPIFEDVKGYETEVFEISRDEEEGTINLLARTEEGLLTHYRIVKENMKKSVCSFNNYRIINHNLLVIESKRRYSLYDCKNAKKITPDFCQLTILDNYEKCFFIHILSGNTLLGYVDYLGNYTDVKNFKTGVIYGNMSNNEYLEFVKKLSTPTIFNKQKLLQKKITSN